MQKILIATTLPEAGLKKLSEKFSLEIIPTPTEEEVIKSITDKEILIVRSNIQVTAKIIEAAPNLKIIGRVGMGIDNIDRQTADNQNIKILNTPTGNSRSVAEFVFGLILGLSRKITQANQILKQEIWNKNQFTGHELYQKTLGIVGLGNIGKLVAQIASGFSMNILGFDPFLNSEQFKQLNIEQKINLNELLAEADIITLHLPKTKETSNLISDEEFKIMKKNALIINCARGGIINEEALFNALSHQQIAGAAIDTWEQEPCTKSPLFTLDNVIATPHLGGATVEAQQRCVMDLIDQLNNF